MIKQRPGITLDNARAYNLFIPDAVRLFGWQGARLCQSKCCNRQCFCAVLDYWELYTGGQTTSVLCLSRYSSN